MNATVESDCIKTIFPNIIFIFDVNILLVQSLHFNY